MSDVHAFNPEREEVLNILRELHGSPHVSQRELSSRLGISLGKVNFLLKALIHKGFIKAENFKNKENKTIYLYLLTPRGIEEKARITYHFLKRKIQEYDRLEEEIHRLKREIAQHNHTADEP